MRLRVIYDVLTNIARWPFLTWKDNTYSLTKTSLGGGKFRGCNIGDYVFIGTNTSACYTDIGPYTCIASNVVIGGMEHAYWYYSINPKLNPHCKLGERTRIGSDVWIGANVVIRQGVTIGDGAVIGAGSIVTHDVPENSIAMGVPARVINLRFTEDVWQRVKDSRYYDCTLKQAMTIVKDL